MKNAHTAMTSKIEHVTSNIQWAAQMVSQNGHARIVAVVCSSPLDQEYWQKKLEDNKSFLFNSNGKTLVFSLQEKIGSKKRAGNFLGTLLAYRNIKDKVNDQAVNLQDHVVLLGMLFGRGERISPFSQIKGNLKPAIRSVAPKLKDSRFNSGLAVIEEALHFFSPLTVFLERNGFKGILCKWGDETQVPAIDISSRADNGPLDGYDVIKFVSVLKITDELAKEKDWVVFDDQNNMLAQLSRNDKNVLVEQLKKYGISPREDQNFYAGISLGSVAASYEVLDIAAEIFEKEIGQQGVYFDFDPYFFMALCMENDNKKWAAAVAEDSELQDLERMVPDFFKKVQSIKTIFEQKYQRPLNLKIFDLGENLYWADIGQHLAMRDKFMALNNKSEKGRIAAEIEQISSDRDSDGNIIIDSYVSDDVIIRNSVVIHSVLAGAGLISDSVVKNCVLYDMDIDTSFAVDSVRLDTTVEKRCGVYESIGEQNLELSAGFRHGTLLLDSGAVDLMVSEDIDLRDKENTYNIPVLHNTISFQDAFDQMVSVGQEELSKRRQKLVGPILKTILKNIKPPKIGNMDIVAQIFKKQGLNEDV